MGEFEEFAEALLDQISVEIDEEKEIAQLSERINVPSSKLRGFEYGKIGPKDGADFVGGNYFGL